MTSPLRPGVRVLDRLFKATPSMSVARMTPAQLARVQAAVIPDRLPAQLLLGRPRDGVEIRLTSCTVRHGELPARIYTPEAWSRNPRPVVLCFHGGGFVLGSARQSDWMCSTVAADLDAIVVSVDYRLAPAHQFPAAVEDCY